MENTQDLIVIHNVTALLASILIMILIVTVLYLVLWPRIDKKWRSKRRRRKQHLQAINGICIELRFKIINIAMACERGDLSLTAFNRRTLNAARLLRRYEVKKNQLTKFIG